SGPNARIVRVRVARAEILKRGLGLECPEAISNLDEESVSGVRIVVAEVVVVEIRLGNELLVRPGRKRSVEVGGERSPILWPRPVTGHVVDRLRLETSTDADAEDWLIAEVHALVETAALFTVEEVVVEIRANLRPPVGIQPHRRCGGVWI